MRTNHDVNTDLKSLSITIAQVIYQDQSVSISINHDYRFSENSFKKL